MNDERYCTCQTVWELPCPVHAELTPPAKRWLAKIKSEAWDEGFDAGELDAMDNLATEDHDCTPNPYTDN